MSRWRNEDGFVLASAMVIAMILMGLGLGLLTFANSQQHFSAYEQSQEGAYALAEAALNAEVAELNSQWPTSISPAPASCNHSTSSTAGCPNAGFDSAYQIGGGSCPAGTASDPWGAPLTNGWTTYVRDDGGGTSQLYNSTVDETQPTYDAGGATAGVPDGSVWVRAVGVENCHLAVVIAKVTQVLTPLTMPQEAVTGNSFATSNNGNKIIIDTLGTYGTYPSGQDPNAQPGGISMRCKGLGSNPCASYRAGSQISPDTCGYNSSTNTCSDTAASLTPTFTTAQLQEIQAEAEEYNTYFGPGNCPSSLSQLSSQPMSGGGVSPVYITGPCNLSFTGGTGNSSSSPGYLVIADGTLTLNGNASFYGIVYAANQQSSSGNVVTLHGNATLQGAIDVDGYGAVNFGSSAVNFIYDSRGFGLLKIWGGAATSPNTFRVLSSGQ